MKLSIIGLIVLGVLAAFSAALLMGYMSGDFRVPQMQRDNASATVLVIKSDLPSVTIITEDMIEQTSVSAKEAPGGYLSNPIQVVGKALTRSVTKGQALTSDCFAGNRRGQDLVAMLPPGRRAVTVDLTLAAGLEGLLYPGSIVDVLASFDLKQAANSGTALSTTLVQGVEVLAIDDNTVMSDDKTNESDSKAGKAVLNPKSRRVTLGVNPKQAAALQLATEHGSVSLAMRNPLDKENPDQEPTLLSDGKLAGLAEYLQASVANTPHEADKGETVASTHESASAAERRWEVTVMRGTAVEVRSLTQDAAGSQTVMLGTSSVTP